MDLGGDQLSATTTELLDFIVDEIVHGRALTGVGPDDDLLASGIVDSLGVTQLVTFVQDRYGIRVVDGDLDPANFRNVRAIEAFIARKRGGVPC
jgi:acyl carrier protein